MMQIKNVVRQSTIPHAGLGCFTTEFVPKGALIWKFEPNFDRKYSKAEFEAFKQPVKDFIDYYGYMYQGFYYVSCDNTRFMNHSETPNLYSEETDFCVYAARDIQAGEELTDNYRTFGITEEDHEFNLYYMRQEGHL